MELSGPKKLNKTCLGESGCLSNLYYLLAAQASNFLICSLSRTQSIRPHLVASTSPCSPCVTYGRLCHSISHQVLPTQPLPREAQDFPRGGKCLQLVYNMKVLNQFAPWDMLGLKYRNIFR